MIRIIHKHICDSPSVCLFFRCVPPPTRRQRHQTSPTPSPCSRDSKPRKALTAAAVPAWPPHPLHLRSAGAWPHPCPTSRAYGLRGLPPNKPTRPQAGPQLSTSKRQPNRRPASPWRPRDEGLDYTERGLGEGQGHSFFLSHHSPNMEGERATPRITKQHGHLQKRSESQQKVIRETSAHCITKKESNWNLLSFFLFL